MKSESDHAAARFVAIVRDMLAAPSPSAVAYVQRQHEAYWLKWRSDPSYRHATDYAVSLIATKFPEVSPKSD